MKDIIKLEISDLTKLLAQRKISSEELTSAFLAQAEHCEPFINAFINLFPEQAMQNAKESDKRRSKNRPLSVYDGIPFAVKDNICAFDTPTTCASRILSGFISSYDAKAVSLLKEKGFILLGKTNMDEFGMGSSTETSAFSPTKNPLDLTRVPGGSSGGSAAAVCAYEVPFALGSDTGGSVRQPAAYCGNVGFKPTYGAVSRFGLVAFASSLDQIGPITKSVADAQTVFGIISGYDEKDARSNASGNNFRDCSLPLTVGIPKDIENYGIPSETLSAFYESIRIFKDMHANVVPVTLPLPEPALSAYYIISSAEASSNLSRFDGIRYGKRTSSPCSSPDELYTLSRTEGFGKEVKKRIILGTYALSKGYSEKYYGSALSEQKQIISQFNGIFKNCDVILTPTVPDVAQKLGKMLSDPLKMYQSDVFTVYANLAALPAISLPCAQNSDSMPIGLQLIGPMHGDNALMNVARAFEQHSAYSSYSFKRSEQIEI